MSVTDDSNAPCSARSSCMMLQSWSCFKVYMLYKPSYPFAGFNFPPVYGLANPGLHGLDMRLFLEPYDS